MASVMQETPFHERRHRERRQLRYAASARTAGMQVSWGGIWAGVLVALSLVVLLAALGVAVGSSSLDAQRPELESIGLPAAAWAAFSLLASLFIGGLVSTRVGAIFDRTTGFFEGVLVWIVCVLLTAGLVGSGFNSFMNGALRSLGGTSAAGAPAPGALGLGPDISSGDVDQIAARLRDPATAQQLAAATGLAPTDVQDTLQETAQRVEQNRGDPAQATAEARQGMAQLLDRARVSGSLRQRAEESKQQASVAAWASFGALLLSLVAAVAGAMIGRRSALAARPD